MRQIIRLTLCAMALVGTTLPAQAQWYAGASAGQARASFRGESQSEQFLDLGFTDATSVIDDKDTMYRLHAGYRVSRHFAVELGYVDLGKFAIRSTVLPAGFLATSLKSSGADVSAVGTWPLSEQFMLFGRVGAYASRTKASYSSGGSVRLITDNQSKSSARLVYGAGATYDFTPKLGLRAEWMRYDRLGDDFSGGEFNVRTISAGIQWRF